jgi:predicted HD superfamily hydrolase involved in NAD metabolism
MKNNEAHEPTDQVKDIVPTGTAKSRALRTRMKPELPTGLLAHIDRVVTVAGTLAHNHGADLSQTLLAAQGHDLLRALPDRELLEKAKTYGIKLLQVEHDQPVLLHGPLAALELRERFGLEDELVLEAIRWHTTGHPNFGLEAWAMFVADKVEPVKLAIRPELQRIIAIAEHSLEAAALAYLELQADQGVREGFELHPLAIETRKALSVEQ